MVSSKTLQTLQKPFVDFAKVLRVRSNRAAFLLTSETTNSYLVVFVQNVLFPHFAVVDMLQADFWVELARQALASA